MHFKLFTCYVATFFALFICLTYSSHGVLESISPKPDIPIKDNPNGRNEARVLRAARLKSDLKPRSIRGTLRHNHELHYLDESLLGKPIQFTARLHIASKESTLLLEEIEHELDDIQCDKTMIKLEFTTSEILKLAYKEYSSVDHFNLVTSHEGCNTEGERHAYRVSKVSILEKEKSMVLTVFPISWKDAFPSLTVDFGGSNADFEVRPHSDLRKRQNITPTALITSGQSTTSTYSSSSTSIFFPVPPSSSPTPKNSKAHGDVGFQHLDTAILPPDVPGASILGSLGAILNGFTIKCKNCTAQGTIDLLQGSFSLDQKNGANDTENIIQFLSDGYIELRVDNFAAHIELESSVQPSTSLTQFTVLLPEIGLPGFQIPGIAVVGPVFNPSITVGVQLGAAFDFVYGFDITVPNNSSIIININNVTNSSVTGFPDTKISAIPFQAEVESVSLALFTSFTPELLLGISVFDRHGSAGLGVFFDLPTIKATISQVARVDSKCNPVTNSSTARDLLDDIFGSLTKIVPEVDFDLGLVAQAELDAILDFKTVDQWTAVSTAFTLPTACFSFDESAKTYGAAVSKTSSASATATGNGKGFLKKNAAVEGILNPFTGFLRRLGRLESVAGALALVFGYFLAL